MGAIASQTTSLTIVYSDADQRRHQSPAQMASNAENVSIWWRHHGCLISYNILKIIDSQHF